MSSINMEKIISESARSSDMEATYAFKLTQEMKDEFFAVCEKHGLSPGKVARGLLAQFLDAMR